MKDFQHITLGQRVLFGTGQAATNVAAEIARLGAKNVMVIAAGPEEQMARAVARDVTPAVWWNDVFPHVPLPTAESARAAALTANIDAIISVGGGSTTGLAKAVALTSGIPVIAVPTTYAGSEATNVWGLTDERTKTTGVDDRVLPVAIVYDADLSKTLPIDLSVASGLNGLAHCVDSLWAPNADPINQALALEGVRALNLALRGIVADPDDIEAREQALYGCYLAAVSFASAGSGLHHKICHVLGGTFELPHAQTHATVLPYVLAFNAPAVPDLACRLAEALGYEGEAVSPSVAANRALQSLRTAVNAPSALAAYGFTEKGIAEAVERILRAAPVSNPVPVTSDNMFSLLTAALHGTPPNVEAIDTSALADDEVEQKRRELDLIDQVADSFDDTPDLRLKQILQSLTRHVHRFLRDVRLTEEEWNSGIEYLTQVGHITDDKRQEFVLLSDVFGASMQTILMNNPANGDATEATVFGPFFVENAPRIEIGGDIAGGAPGQACWVSGTVKDTDGNSVANARVEVWEADEDGFYDVQYSDDRVAGRAHLYTDAAGRFAFWGLTPTPYPIPHDGPVGRMLSAAQRSPVRAAHLHFMVTAPGLRRLVTHIFVEGDPQLAIGDSVFGVQESLIKKFEVQPAGVPTPDGRDLGNEEWALASFDIALAAE